MSRPPDCLRLFLAGDVMLGRGIDQIQRHSCDQKLYEGYLGSAQDYVTLAERVSGEIPRHVGPDYVWGDLLEDLETRQVDLRLINLESAITSGGTHDPDKGIHYRMHPATRKAASTICSPGTSSRQAKLIVLSSNRLRSGS